MKRKNGDGGEGTEKGGKRRVQGGVIYAAGTKHCEKIMAGFSEDQAGRGVVPERAGNPGNIVVFKDIGAGSKGGGGANGKRR